MADLQKMAIRDFAPGKKLEEESSDQRHVYDYTHVLQQSKGPQTPGLEAYRLHVAHEPDNNDRLEALLFHGPSHVGSVVANQRPVGDVRGIETHSQLGRSYRGYGLGQAMYEAVMAHALHSGLGTHVIGGVHSEAAGRVHEKLSERHGMGYERQDAPEDSSFDRGSYGYAIKAELEKSDTPEFAEWFAGSHVKDAEGRPLRVYHGTSKDRDFSTFKIGQRGAWFSTEPEEASEYAATNDSQGYSWESGKPVRTNTASRVIPAYLSLKNPYYMTGDDQAALNAAAGRSESANSYKRPQAALFQQARAKGHDGVVLPGGKAFVAFHPHQIKSVFNQRPTAESGHLSKTEGEMVKAEDLAKMAVIHEDAARPMTVYRLEGPNGESPYQGSFDRPEIGELLNAHSRGTNYVATPAPSDDFDEPDIRQHLTGAFSKPDHPYRAYKFAFEHPDHAANWFGHDGLAGLAQHGYTLKPVQASRVIRSGSGKQVMYLPHQSVAKAEGEASPAQPQVALVIATDAAGRLLLGKRRDGSGWTLPGGHVEPKDGSTEEAAVRELFEETGLRPVSITFQRQAPGDGCDLWVYSALVRGVPHGRNDPDQEVEKWQFVDARGGLPSNIYDNLCGPDDDTNVVRQLFDLRRSEAVWLEDAGFADLRKSDSEASVLLGHPDPRERAMAIKLAGATSADVATAVLDPDPWVWRSAFAHEKSAHALDVLAASHRDASGLPLYDRHDALLKDPRCTAGHVRMMYRAAAGDHELPDDVRASRLVALEGHPLGQHADIPIGGKLAKNWAHDEIHGATHSEPSKARPFAEKPMQHLGPLVEAYKTYVGSAKGMFATDADLHHPGSASTKVVYKVPVAGHDKPRRLMVKAYSEHQAPLAGWAEGTSQAMYHAGGIGHLHQQSFVATHGKGATTVPALVIHIEDAVPSHGHRSLPPGQLAPDVASQARKVAMMDFLNNHFDRHVGNLMVKQDGNLLAIDHGLNFKYHYAPKAQRFDEFSEDGAPELFGSSDHDQYGDAFEWWRQNSPAIKKAFDERTDLINDPKVEEELRHGFDTRAAHLDRWAAQHAAGTLPPDWAHTWPHTQGG